MSKVTSKDVAIKAGVSRATVSCVLNNSKRVRISPETRKKVLEAAAELKYYPNVLAQSLKTKRSKIIGLVIPSITNPFFPSIAQGVEDVAVEHGYNLFLCNSFRNRDKESSYIDALASKQVDGIIFASMTYSAQAIQRLQDSDVRIVAFDRRISLEDVDAVLFDNRKGAEIAVEHLISLGHKNIAFLSGTTQVSSRQARLDGYKASLENHGLSVNPKFILQDKHHEYENRRSNYEIDVGYRLGKQLIEKNPEVTAIFAVNDMTALGALKAVRSLGLKVPRDISLVGFDDIMMSELTDPPLTTVAQPKYEMGRAAAELLISRLEDEKASARHLLVFPPELIVRKSCSPTGS